MGRGVVTVVAATVLVLLAVMALVLFLPPFLESQTKSGEMSQAEEVRELFYRIQQELYGMAQGDSRTFVLPMSSGSFSLYPTGRAASLSFGMRWSENDLGRLVYSMAARSYPSYTLVLEGGGVILEQEGRSLMTLPPFLVRTLDLGDNLVRVEVEWIYLMGENVRVSKRSPATLTVQGLEEGYSLWTENEPNAEDVVVDLENRVEYDSVWERYLQELGEELNAKGLNASVSGLKLTVLGKVTASGTKDLYYFEHYRKVGVWLA
jgi:hypothetical protein